MKNLALLLLLCAGAAQAQDRLVSISPFEGAQAPRPAASQAARGKAGAGSKGSPAKTPAAPARITLPMDNPLLDAPGTSAKGLKPVGDLEVYRTMDQASQALERRALAEAARAQGAITVAAAAVPWWVTFRTELIAGAGAAIAAFAFLIWRRG